MGINEKSAQGDVQTEPNNLTPEEQRAVDNAKRVQSLMDEMNGEKNNASTGETGVKVLQGPAAAEDTLGKTLADHVSEIEDMGAVKKLSGEEMNDRAKKPSEQIANFFKRIGNKVLRHGLGEVILDDYGVSSEINHRPLNRAKMVTVESVPEVIKNGRIISDVENWKGRGYRSIVIAAPVEIVDSTVYVAAVVNQHQDNKFYLHEVVDSNGNYIRIETDETGTSKSRITVEDGITTMPETSASMNSISQATAESQYANEEIATPQTKELGAANAGFTTTPGEQVQTQNKTVTQPKGCHFFVFISFFSGLRLRGYL